MKYIHSKNCIKFIARWEGYEPKVYKCSAKVDTIGYGHVILKSEEYLYGAVLSEADALALLNKDVLTRFTPRVSELVEDLELTQNQFDALVSFAFNCGVSALGRSTLLKRLKAGKIANAADQFLVWNKARVKGVLTPLKGLTNRRQAEKELFLKG